MRSSTTGSGQSLLALGDTVDAHGSLVRARDEDLLKFRAPARTDSIIHDVCRERRSSLPRRRLAVRIPLGGGDSRVDALLGAPPSQRAGVRPNREGVRSTKLLRFVPPTAGTGLLPFDADSLDLSWLDLAYGELSVRALTGRWPFSDFTSPSPLLNSGDATEKGIVTDIYTKKTAWTDACLRFALYEEKAGRVREAAADVRSAHR